MKRRFDPDVLELMDRPQPVSPELEDDLESLEWLNARFGAHGFLRRFLDRHCAGRKSVRALDLATGGGDLPRVAVDWARARGIAISVDALDFHPSTLAIAQKRSADCPEIRWHLHDVRQPWVSGSYDLVLCFLALHHFTEEDAVTILRRMREAARGGSLLVCDIERSRLGAMAIWLLTQFVLTAPMTRHDARVSMRRAFSLREFRQLLGKSGWTGFTHARVAVCRQAAWLLASDRHPAD